MNKMRITWGEVGEWFVYGRMKLKCFLDLSMWFISERMDNDRCVWSSKKDFGLNWKVGAKVVKGMIEVLDCTSIKNREEIDLDLDYYSPIRYFLWKKNSLSCTHSVGQNTCSSSSFLSMITSVNELIFTTSIFLPINLRIHIPLIVTT
jgi:hypothetical protein